MDNSSEASPADRKQLTAWLRKLHKKSKLPVAELAFRAEADPKSVYRWLKGEHEPQGVALLKLLAALGVETQPQVPPALVGYQALPAAVVALQKAVDSQRQTLDDFVDLVVEELVQPARKKPRRRQASS